MKTLVADFLNAAFPWSPQKDSGPLLLSGAEQLSMNTPPRLEKL